MTIMRTVIYNYQPTVASGRRSSWARLVTAIDPAKTNGYAITGPWLRPGENAVAQGALVVECVPTGTRAHAGEDLVAYRAVADREAPEISRWDWATAKVSALRSLTRLLLGGVA